MGCLGGILAIACWPAPGRGRPERASRHGQVLSPWSPRSPVLRRSWGLIDVWNRFVGRCWCSSSPHSGAGRHRPGRPALAMAGRRRRLLSSPGLGFGGLGARVARGEGDQGRVPGLAAGRRRRRRRQAAGAAARLPCVRRENREEEKGRGRSGPTCKRGRKRGKGSVKRVRKFKGFSANQSSLDFIYFLLTCFICAINCR